MHDKRSDRQNRLIHLLFCFLACSLIPMPLLAVNESSATLMEQTIISLHKVRTSISENQLTKVEQIQQSPHSRDDVLLFLTYLDGRIYYYCQELLLILGPDGLTDLPCPSSAGGALQSPQFEPVPRTSGQTSGEKVAKLESDFNAALGEFDDMLLEEQETVAAHIPKQRENSSTSTSPYDGDKGLPTWQSSADQPVETDASQKSSSENSSSQESGRNTSNNRAGIGKKDQTKLPPTAGRKDLSKDDDDIVARQLREAAEQEPDPEIKAKLWDEYRKYKEGIK